MTPDFELVPLSASLVPALSPEELSDVTQASVSELLAEGQSSNTVASYRAALRYWAAWYGLRYGGQLRKPVPIPVVIQFIVDHAQRTKGSERVHDLPPEIDAHLVKAGFKGKLGPMAITTLTHRVSVLSTAHGSNSADNPCKSAPVHHLLTLTRKAYAKRGDTPRKKQALTSDPLEAVLATCDESPKGIRDRALLLFAWSSGGRRRSEVALADMRDLQRVGMNEYAFVLARSKTNQTGAPSPNRVKPVVGRAGAALSRWLSVSGVKTGAIFRQVNRGGGVGEALSPAAVREIVIARCSKAGIHGDFSAHSLRSGFVTEAGRRNMPPAEAMKMTDHKSVAVFMGYFQAGDVLQSEVARMMDVHKNDD